MEKIRVDLGDRGYDIVLGFDNLSGLGARVAELIAGKKLAVITNKKIWDIYGAELGKSLENSGFEVHCFPVIAGEQAKTLGHAEKLYQKLMECSFDRKCGVVAFGGGVVGDLAGFVAATYMRGIPFIQVPTSLLAQVDSSVGGKVAVNLPMGKNLVGAFYQPKLVYMDLGVLDTLPKKELLSGIAEVVKYGVIRDGDFFEFLEKNYKSVLALKKDELMHAVKTSCLIKAEVVRHDEREGGVRAILNFGHTFAHGIELLESYKGLSHGEAVGIGMVYAAKLSRRISLCDGSVPERISGLISRIGLPSHYSFEGVENLLELFYRDKKVESSRLKFVLTQSIGSVTITDMVEDEVLIDVLIQHVRASD